ILEIGTTRRTQQGLMTELRFQFLGGNAQQSTSPFQNMGTRFQFWRCYQLSKSFSLSGRRRSTGADLASLLTRRNHLEGTRMVCMQLVRLMPLLVGTEGKATPHHAKKRRMQNGLHDMGSLHMPHESYME
ncbi:unnamed protein product, partial [Closterium sp. Naga37s-1]